MSRIYYSLSSMYVHNGGDSDGATTFTPKEILSSRLTSRKVVINEALKALDPSMHDVTSKSKRPDKMTFKPNGDKDAVTGEDKMVMAIEPVSRAPIRVQRYIVSQKASFARGNGIRLKPSDENSKVFKKVYENWYENKTDFYLKEIAEAYLGETQVAVIFFSDFDGANTIPTIEDLRLRFKILKPSKGDVLYPIYDQDTEELISLCREYMRGEDTFYDFYIAPEEKGGFAVLRRFKGENETVFEEKQLPYKKLPLVYWERNEPECEDTQPLIDELESSFSDFLDQVKYTGDPILFGKGRTLNLPAKGTPGKYIEGSEDADIKFVTPDDNATDSRELAFDMLQKFIFSLNRAVVLDLEVMKNLSDVSGAALDRYLTDVYMEASDHQNGYWGLGVQRMVNFMLDTWKYAMSEENDKTTIDVGFTRYRLDDMQETVNTILLANGNQPLIDHQASISLAGLADDPAVSFQRIQEQITERAKQTAEAAQKQQQAAAQPGSTDNNRK